MNWVATIDTGVRSLFGHRMRSVLTTLGVLFGIAAVICTVGIGQASSNSVAARVEALGTNLLTVTPGSATSSGVAGGAGTANSLTMADVAGLSDRRDAPDIAAVAPIVQGAQTLVLGSSNWTTTVEGSTPGWLRASARTSRSSSASCASSGSMIPARR